MYRSLSAGDSLAEVARLQREMQRALDTFSPSMRAFARGYPALNVGSTPTSVEIDAFAPGIDPTRIEIQLEQGMQTIAGERVPAVREGNGRATTHINEHLEGRFRRGGVQQLSARRRESAQPRRIEVQRVKGASR